MRLFFAKSLYFLLFLLSLQRQHSKTIHFLLNGMVSTYNF